MFMFLEYLKRTWFSDECKFSIKNIYINTKNTVYLACGGIGRVPQEFYDKGAKVQGDIG